MRSLSLGILIWGLLVPIGVAQIGGKLEKDTGGWKKSRLNDRGAEGNNDADNPFVLVRLGDTVRSNTFALGLKKVQFEAIAGTRIDLRLKCEAAGVAPPLRLKNPAGTIVAESVPKAGAREAEIKGFELKDSGLYTLAVGGIAVDVANCELTTSAVFPRKLERTVDIVAGRPVVIEFGGMTGRTLSELQADGDDADVDLVAELRDPRGEKIDLGERLRVAPDGKSVALNRQQLDQSGEFKLYVTDKKRGTARLNVKAVFDNPPLSKKTHTIY